MDKNIFYKEFSKISELKEILDDEIEVNYSSRSLEELDGNLYGAWNLTIGDSELKFIFKYEGTDKLVVQVDGDVIAKTATIDASDYESVEEQLAAFAVSLFNDDVDGAEDEEGSFDDMEVDKTAKDATESLNNSRLIYKVYGKK